MLAPVMRKDCHDFMFPAVSFTGQPGNLCSDDPRLCSFGSDVCNLQVAAAQPLGACCRSGNFCNATTLVSLRQRSAGLVFDVPELNRRGSGSAQATLEVLL